MQLTLYTDYSLRVLIYLALKEDRATIPEIAEQYAISRNHLIKVVHHLGKAGFIITQRGRNGGIKLKHSPDKVRLGTVVRVMEPNFTLVECFDAQHDACVVSPVCRLKGILGDALQNFMKELDQYSLADVIGDPKIYRACIPALTLPERE